MADCAYAQLVGHAMIISVSVESIALMAAVCAINLTLESPALA